MREWHGHEGGLAPTEHPVEAVAVFETLCNEGPRLEPFYSAYLPAFVGLTLWESNRSSWTSMSPCASWRRRLRGTKRLWPRKRRRFFFLTLALGLGKRNPGIRCFRPGHVILCVQVTDRHQPVFKLHNTSFSPQSQKHVVKPFIMLIAIDCFPGVRFATSKLAFFYIFLKFVYRQWANARTKTSFLRKFIQSEHIILYHPNLLLFPWIFPLFVAHQHLVSRPRTLITSSEATVFASRPFGGMASTKKKTGVASQIKCSNNKWSFPIKKEQEMLKFSNQHMRHALPGRLPWPWQPWHLPPGGGAVFSDSSARVVAEPAFNNLVNDGVRRVASVEPHGWEFAARHNHERYSGRGVFGCSVKLN